MPFGILFDVDGTLVDTNYLHVVAWWHAFRAHGHTVPMRRLHETVGQGSDRFVETILGRPDEDISNAHTDFYGPFLHELAPFEAPISDSVATDPGRTRFQGQTSWQTSHPNTHSPMRGRRSGAIEPRCSMVR